MVPLRTDEMPRCAGVETVTVVGAVYDRAFFWNEEETRGHRPRLQCRPAVSVIAEERSSGYGRRRTMRMLTAFREGSWACEPSM